MVWDSESYLSLVLLIFKISLILGLFWLHQVFVVAQARLLPHVGCPRACGILVPQPGSKPASLTLEGRFSTPGPLGKSLLQQRRRGRWGEGTPTHSFLVGVEVQVPRSASLTLEVGRGLHYWWAGRYSSGSPPGPQGYLPGWEGLVCLHRHCRVDSGCVFTDGDDRPYWGL